MFSAFGIDGDGLVARFNEGLQLMKALWTEQSISFDGRFWQLKDAAMDPKPFQKPYPPIWFGGSHPAALRRAVRYGDGFFGAGSSTTAQFADQVRTVRDALVEAERDGADFRIAKRVYIAVDDDAERAQESVRASLHDLYASFGLPDLTPVAVFGPPDACVRGLRDVADAGAEMILLNPLTDAAAQMERLAAEVVPGLNDL
jgi:alkanesulfonate monooxygenase SsuD/methylene tetrahydromethanopterin reductase-like flavin-dependent oxidoreductase (luciferase family)